MLTLDGGQEVENFSRKRNHTRISLGGGMGVRNKAKNQFITCDCNVG